MNSFLDGMSLMNQVVLRKFTTDSYTIAVNSEIWNRKGNPAGSKLGKYRGTLL